MINQEEIERAADSLGVHTSSVQRDYVFGWLLAGLFRPDNPLSQKLILKGGNAFRKAYFPIARYSNDLDFSTITELDSSTLTAGLTSAAEYAGAQSGVDFTARRLRVEVRPMADSEVRMHEARVYFKSFYGEEDVAIRVDLDVREFDRVVLPVQQRNLIHEYSDRDICRGSVRCWKLEELLAAKLKALLHREHSPDLFDFVHALFVQRVLEVDRLAVVRTLLKKSIYESSPSTLQAALLHLPLQAFATIWEEFLELPNSVLIAFEEAERRFREGIEILFGLLPRPIGARPAYAGAGVSQLASPYRSTILEAGRLQRILRIVYDGFSRRVEPYALAYKRRRDGVASEYFYAWDLTGGRSGTTGIKSFFADKLEAVAITEDEFEPKYPIELTKSGIGFFSSPSFSTPGTYGQRPSTKPRRSVPKSGLNYTVRCPYCGKRFRRSKPSTRLNKHTDRSGNQCFGRSGYLV